LRRISEELTRKELIDPQLERAGWYLRDHSKVKIEIPVDGYDAEPWNGVTDYCLYRENGEVLAVVEAKKTTVDVRLAQAQLEHYVRKTEGLTLPMLNEIEVPIVPLPKQEQFAAVVRRVESLRAGESARQGNGLLSQSFG